MTAKWILYREQLRQLGQPNQERLRIALRWAICSVHTPIKLHESEFASYQWYGRYPSYLRNRKKRALIDAERFVNNLDWDAFLALDLEAKIEFIVKSIFGLGYAKTALALDCAQIEDIACLDIWIARARLGVGKRIPTFRNAKQYLGLVEQAFGSVSGSGIKQWYEFYRIVPAFRQTNHAIMFQAMGVETERQLPLIDFEIPEEIV